MMRSLIMICVLPLAVLADPAARIERHCRQLKKDQKVQSKFKKIVRRQEGRWWMSYWDPNWSCPTEEKIGLPDAGHSQDGEKWVCDTEQIKPGCIVYSVGSNGNYLFETGMHGRFNCEIHVFDPTYLGDTTKHKYLNIHAWGIDSTTHTTQKTEHGEPVGKPVQLKSLPDIIEELGHTGKTIDILKIDVEGFEFGVLDNTSMWKTLEFSGTEIRQVLAEIHLSGINRETFRWRDVNRYEGGVVDNLFRVMHQQGYGIFHKEVNALPQATMQCTEYGFVKIDVDCNTLTSKKESVFVY